MKLRRMLLAQLCLFTGAACGSGSGDGRDIISAFKDRVAVDAPKAMTQVPTAPAPGANPVPVAKGDSSRVGVHATRVFAAGPGGFAAAASKPEGAKSVTPSGSKSLVIKAHPAAKVTAPARSTGPFHVEDEVSRMAIDATVRGADNVRGSVSEGYVVYPNAIRGGHWIHAATNDGMQDYVSFDDDTSARSLSYDVALTNVASLRLVANSLEFIDKNGAPRLRVPAPYVVGSDHKEHAAKLAVQGCAVDTSPLAPWGRAMPEVGASHCTVNVDWSDVDLTYPAVIDPSWTTTGSMANPRFRHAAAALANGRVLVAGGHNRNVGQTPTAEIYDSTTGTWASTSDMTVQRYQLTMNALPDGTVLAIASSSFTASTETYDPTTGLWTARGSMRDPRFGQASVTLSDGRVFVVGGSWYDPVTNTQAPYLKSAEIYDAGTWTPIADTSDDRMHPTADLLHDGRVLVAGGLAYGAWRGGASGEIFDPASGTWTPTGPMNNPDRMYHASMVLADGRVLVAGGSTGMWGDAVNTAEIYDPATNAWTDLGPVLSAPRWELKSVMSNGRYYFIGGESGSTWNPAGPASAVIDAFNGVSWEDTSDSQMTTPRAWFTATALPSGILVAGGEPEINDTSVNTAEVLTTPGGNWPRSLVPSDIGHGRMQTPNERIFVRAFVDYDGTSNSPPGNQFPTADPAASDRMFFGGDGGLNVNDFYKTVSHGSFQWKSAGFIGPADPTNPALKRPIIAHVSEAVDEVGRFRALEYILAQAVAQGFPFQDYDTKEPFGDIRSDELTFVIISNGNTKDGLAQGGAVRGVWNGIEGSGSSDCVPAGGAYSHGMPVRICGGPVPDFGKDASMQVVTHEMAHVLGAIDMYPETSKGLGNTNATTMGGVNPYPGPSDRAFSLWIEAWHRMQFGWDLPKVVDATTIHNETFTFTNPGDILALHYGPERFFLLESRKRATPYDGNVHEDGVAVWYVEQDANHKEKFVPAIEGMQSGMLYDSSFIRTGESFELNWPGSSNYSLTVTVATDASGRFVVNYKSFPMLAYRGAIQGYGSKCMDAGEWFAPSDARLNDCRGTRSQSWVYNPFSKLILDANGQRCLEMPDTLGWRLLVNTCNQSNPLQQWTWNQASGTLSAGGKCARVANGWVNGLVSAADCSGDTYDLWRLAPNVQETNPPRVSIQSTTSGCLQPLVHQTNAWVQTVPCTGAASQQWQIFGTGEIKKIERDLCLEALGGSGEGVVVRDCQHAWETKRPGLLWDVEPSGRLRNSNGLLLTSLGSVPPGEVSIDGELNSPFQTWTITPAPPPSP